MEREKLAERNGCSAYVAQDTDAENPRREWDNAGHMVCWHRRYNLGDKHAFSAPEDFREWWKHNGKGGLCFGLSLLDHSGLHMYMGHSAHWSDAQGWDSGPVGYIYITRAEIQHEWGKRKGNTAKARKYLEVEVETFDQFLTGDVYGYMIEDKDGEHLDSCWGFFGYEYAKEQALDALGYEAERARDFTERAQAVNDLR